MLKSLLPLLHDKASHRLWICSDLQQTQPDNARHCMTRAVDDLCSLGLRLDGICYLGDATQGKDLAHLQDMTQMQIQQFSRLNTPVYYALGNHDFDCNWKGQTGDPLVMPFYEAISVREDWHTIPDLTQTHFFVDMGAFALMFLSDHGDPQGQWYTTMGERRRDAEAYPYTQEHFLAICQEIRALGKPVFTLSHYAFPGGNRPTQLMAQMLPLPANVAMHFYGHAHIGDHVFAGQDCFRKISGTHGQALVQVDVASLENIRGNAIQSIVLEVYEDGSFGVLFRNHSAGCWEEAFLVQSRAGQALG